LPITQGELAEKIGVSEVHIRKIKKGEVNPSALVLAKLSIVLKKPVEDLVPDIYQQANEELNKPN